MELVKEFGIDIRLLTAQIVNFLIILYLLKRFAYKPILEVLKKREEMIKDSLAKAQETQRLFEKAQEEEKKMLNKAYEQASQILEETKREQENMLLESEKITKKRVDKMMQEAKVQITFETQQAEENLTGRVSELALKILKKALSEHVSNKEQEIFMQNVVKNLRKKIN